LKLPATSSSAAKTIYGADCHQVAQAAVDTIAGPLHREATAKVSRLSSPPVAPPRTLQIQEQQ